MAPIYINSQYGVCLIGAMAGSGAGGGAEADDGQRVVAVATVGRATRDRGGSGSGGPHRACAVKFRPRSPSYIRRRRQFGCGAKILDLDEDIGADGEAGVGHGGAVPGAATGNAANQVGAAAGTNQVDGTAASVRLGADHDGAAAGAGNVAEKMSKHF